MVITNLELWAIARRTIRLEMPHHMPFKTEEFLERLRESIGFKLSTESVERVLDNFVKEGLISKIGCTYEWSK